MRYKDNNTTVIELSDIIEGISADTDFSEKEVEDILTSLRKHLIYYCQNILHGADRDEKYIIKLFPSFYIKIERTPEQRKILNNNEIHIESRVKVKPKFTRYFKRKIVNNLKDG